MNNTIPPLLLWLHRRKQNLEDTIEETENNPALQPGDIAAKMYIKIIAGRLHEIETFINKIHHYANSNSRQQSESETFPARA